MTNSSRGLLQVPAVTTLLLFSGWTPAPAQQASEFEEFMQQDQQAFESFAAENQAQFDRFVEEFEKEFAAFSAGIDRKWGEVKVPDNKRFVEYGADSTTVAEIDCEKGVVTVEVLPKKGETDEQAKKRLAGTVERIVTHKGTSDLIPIEDKSKKPVLEKPILAGQVKDDKGKEVTPATAKAFAAKAVAKAKPVTVKPKPPKTEAGSKATPPGKPIKKLVVVIPLAPDHLQKRAAPFLEYVGKYAKEYEVDPEHILATIHTESFFNPMARSHCNAMGLMQLMAKSGGREACKYVYKKDVIPPPATLFNPEKNIMLGAAYIRILKKRYYRKVVDDSSRIYCSIAAYNTGPGNVAKAFVGVSKLTPARKKINTMSSAQVYELMIEKLPYKETRDYLARVTRRMPLYR